MESKQTIGAKDVATLVVGAGGAIAVAAPPSTPKLSDEAVKKVYAQTEGRIGEIVAALGTKLALQSRRAFKERKNAAGLTETMGRKQALANRSFSRGDTEKGRLYVFWVWQLQCRLDALKAGTRLVHSEFKGVREMLGAPDEKYVTYLPEGHAAFPVKEEKAPEAPKLAAVPDAAAEPERIAANPKGSGKK